MKAYLKLVIWGRIGSEVKAIYKPYNMGKLPEGSNFHSYSSIRDKWYPTHVHRFSQPYNHAMHIRINNPQIIIIK